MFTDNPFAALSASISPGIMQTYVVVMIILVAGGTLFDIMHKRSAKYFFDNWRNATNKGARQVGGGEMVSLAVQTAVVEVLTSAEFCNAQRRVAHLLTMYGFLAYVITTFDHGVLVPDSPPPRRRPSCRSCGTIGALLVCARRLLVLVLHSGRRRRRGQFAVPHRARRPVHPLAPGERDAGP